jgi:hypothetical protein
MHNQLSGIPILSKPRTSNRAALDQWQRHAAGAVAQQRTPLHILCDGFSCEGAPSCGGAAKGCTDCAKLQGKDDPLMVRGGLLPLSDSLILYLILWNFL